MQARGRLAAVFAAFMVSWLGIAPDARAQTGARAPRWEVEGYGALMVPGGSGDGTATLPPPGPAIATSSPIFPSRRVPSWLFGDGAALLNLVNQELGAAAVIDPLDDALDGTALTGGSGPAGGARVRRRLTERTSIELSVDLFFSSSGLSDELEQAAQATAASFVDAFSGLLDTGPFTSVAVAAASSGGGAGRELAATGALVLDLGGVRLAPYVTFGGGLVTGLGEGAALEIDGRYSFLVIGEVPIDESDRVVIRRDSRTVPVAVAGTGLRYDVADNWGVRIDGRVLFGPQTARLLIDTDPVVAEGTPADFVESTTTPAIQFSNSPSTGRESSLGGPPLEGFEAFVPDGMQVRLLIGFGVFFRF